MAASSKHLRPSSSAAAMVMARTSPIPLCEISRSSGMAPSRVNRPPALTISSCATSITLFPTMPLPSSTASSSALDRAFAPFWRIFSRGLSSAHKSIIFMEAKDKSP